LNFSRRSQAKGLVGGTGDASSTASRYLYPAQLWAPLTGCLGAEGAAAKPFLQAILSDADRESFGDCGQIAAQKAVSKLP
jgi:hypothetical protein